MIRPELPANRPFYFEQSSVFVQIDQERMRLGETRYLLLCPLICGWIFNDTGVISS
jgi:hypothetical protein